MAKREVDRPLKSSISPASHAIYSGPVFEMARRQFEQVADHLAIREDHRPRLLYPKRALVVSCPIHCDDGSTAVFQGYRVQHHLTLGPTKGGTRFSLTVDLGEVAALAIWMSWKCSLAGLPYGGAKGGVTVDPSALSARELEALSRRYMQELIPFVGPHVDVMAPDMGTNEQIMAWFMDTYSMYQGRTVSEVVTGKPVASGGTLGRREATGRGVAHLIGRALERSNLSPRGTTAIIQGFGNVGSVTAAALEDRGSTIVGVSDRTAARYNPKGFRYSDLEAHLKKHGVLRGFANECAIGADEFLTQPCDILVPAATERVITRENAPHLRCRILAEGANGPTTPDADLILSERQEEIFLIPDILCNSGGVIVSYFEWVQDLQQLFWTEAEVFQRLDGILDRSFHQVMDVVEGRGLSHRQAATTIGVERIRACKETRGLFP